jgi:cytochrome c
MISGDSDRRMRRGLRLCAAVLGAVALAACGMGGEERSFADAAALTGGDPEAGREKARELGCGSCHTIPGVTGARSLVGPPLVGIAERMYIAGVLTNTPDHLVRWIMDPQAADSSTAMPNVGASERDARDIAAYLYAVR